MAAQVLAKAGALRDHRLPEHPTGQRDGGIPGIRVAAKPNMVQQSHGSTRSHGARLVLLQGRWYMLTAEGGHGGPGEKI